MVATEVHSLIEVSLGKIAKCKQQKNGVNLRRNLLVASVIHKARVIYVSEVQSARQQGKRAKAHVQKDSAMATEDQNDSPDRHSEVNGDCDTQRKGESRLKSPEEGCAGQPRQGYRRRVMKRCYSLVESESEEESDSDCSKHKRSKPMDEISENDCDYAPSSCDTSNSDCDLADVASEECSPSDSESLNNLVAVFNTSLSAGLAPIQQVKKDTMSSGLPIAMEV